MLVVKALHGMRDHLSPIISARPIRSCKVGALWVPWIKQCPLVGPQKHAFYVAMPALLNKVTIPDPDSPHSVVTRILAFSLRSMARGSETPCFIVLANFYLIDFIVISLFVMTDKELLRVE